MAPAIPDPAAIAAVPDPASVAALHDPAAAVVALRPALREAAEWAAAMLHRLGDAATAPGPGGGWTPTRIVVHLTAVDAEVWTPRLRQLEAHGHPTWAWTEPALTNRPDPSPDAAAEAFVATRVAMLETVAAMDRVALRCTGVHAKFGELDVVGLLGEVLRHDAEHLGSLAEAVAAQSSGAAGGAGAAHG